MRPELVVSLRPNVKRYEGDLPQLPLERGPDSDTWDNSVAICACMLKENITDVREWLQYHRCDPSVCYTFLGSDMSSVFPEVA